MTPSKPAASGQRSVNAFLSLAPSLRRWLGVLVLILGVCLFSAVGSYVMALGSALGLYTALVLWRSVPSATAQELTLRESALTAFAVVLISALAIFTLAYLRPPTPPHPEERHLALVVLRVIFVGGCIVVLLRTWWRSSHTPPRGAA